MTPEADIRKLIESIGLKLYDVETTSESGETIFRVSVLGEGGTTMDQCVEATKLLSPMLDVHPPVHGEYRLEVSSPGIERKLKKPSHFANSVGEKVKLTLQDMTKLRGTLIACKDDTIVVASEHGEETFALNDVYKAATYFEW